MPLATGTRLGPYEILGPLGAGGMGEVYKARDTRLERTVAVKVLPAQTAERTDVRQRFEREARAVSALNHPHICTLHDVGQEGGLDYLVMEYVQGESLAERLKRGPLPLEQALRTAMEVADAVCHAHRTGIIHRDLKPGNIMLSKDGAKVLDFGLAKMRSQSAGAAVSGGSRMDTLTSPLTGEGSIVGTLQYMAPEQLEGKEADARSDVFAFGAVLYEMLTAQRAFASPTQAGLIVQIMANQPAPVSTVMPATPRVLEQLVRTCLAKDPDDRRQTMRDVLLDLRWIASGASQTDAVQTEPPTRRPRNWIWMAATAFFAAATVALAAAWVMRPRPEEPLTRLTLPAPDKATFGPGLAMSADGKRVAFVARPAGGQDLLWVRALDSLAAQPVAGSEGANYPFWSPDGRYVAFFAQGKLKRADAMGGGMQVVCDATDARGGSWGPDGTILFAPEPTVPLHRVAASGGTATPLTKLDPSRSELGQRWPHFLPDGRRFVYFSMCSKPANNSLVLGSLDGKESRVLFPSDSAPAYSPPGYLLFGRGSTLMAQPFRVTNLSMSGDPFPAAQGLAVTGLNAGAFAAAQFSVSATGTLVYQTGGARLAQLAWFDRAGKLLANVGPPGTTSNPDLSPDGKHVVFDGPADLWVLDLARGAPSRFTFNGLGDVFGTWSPDGHQIAFADNRKGRTDLYVKPATGVGAEQLLFSSDVDKMPDDWSRDGRLIVFESFSPTTKYDLWWLPVEGDRKPVSYLQTEFNEGHARLSPDGKWLAFASDETGHSEVYVQSFPAATSGKFLVSAHGGDQPSWRKDGKELFFLAPDRKLMSVDVKIGTSLELGAPKPLFQTEAPTSGVVFRNHYVPSADGQRFLVVTVPPEQSAAPLVVVLNWTRK